MKYLFFSLRPAQWIKNLFIFLPLVFGKKLFVYPANLRTIIAFFLFSMAASVAYLVNDIIDIDKDKAHPTKRLRPITSGKVSILTAGVAALVLGVTSICLSFALNIYFGIVVVAYLVSNVLYSKILKTAVIIDVFCLAFFFYLRIEAGSIVAAVTPSYWIIFMTVLLAIFLGFNKRRYELKLPIRKLVSHRIVLTQYSNYFIDQMISVITASIVVVYMLYTIDPKTVKDIGNDHLIYSIPFVYYGIFRYLYLIHKVKKEGDPTRILMSDRKMQINIVLWIIICVAVIYLGV